MPGGRVADQWPSVFFVMGDNLKASLVMLGSKINYNKI